MWWAIGIVGVAVIALIAYTSHIRFGRWLVEQSGTTEALRDGAVYQRSSPSLRWPSRTNLDSEGGEPFGADPVPPTPTCEGRRGSAFRRRFRRTGSG